VIGLGAIGRLVANAASAGFGMKVVGCDPFMPPSCPDASAAFTSAVFASSPREKFSRIAPFFIFAIVAALMLPRVLSFSGTWKVM